jgi:hypothetical protein
MVGFAPFSSPYGRVAVRRFSVLCREIDGYEAVAWHSRETGQLPVFRLLRLLFTFSRSSINQLASASKWV